MLTSQREGTDTIPGVADTRTPNSGPLPTASTSNEGEPGLPEGASVAQLVGAIRALNLAGERFRQAVADHFDVGLSETSAMQVLSAGGPLSPGQLADLVGLTPSTVTALLDRLERADLAARTPHSSDRRKTVVSVTAGGQRFLDAVQAWLGEAVGVIEPGQIPAATALLAQLAGGLHARADGIADGGRHAVN